MSTNDITPQDLASNSSSSTHYTHHVKYYNFERSDTNLSEEKNANEGANDSRKLLKSILRKESNFDRKSSADEDIFISDVTIKKIRDSGSPTKIKFNDEVKITRIENFKEYNQFGYVPESDKCTCQIF